MIDHRKITLGKLLIILACASLFSSAQSQTKLSSDDVSFIANNKIKYSIVLLSCDTCVPITNVGFRVRVILTNKEEKIVKQIDDRAWMLLLKNDKTDWAANLILYELCDRDAILFSQCKSRKRWIGFLKGQDMDFWKKHLSTDIKKKTPFGFLSI